MRNASHPKLFPLPDEAGYVKNSMQVEIFEKYSHKINSMWNFIVIFAADKLIRYVGKLHVQELQVIQK